MPEVDQEIALLEQEEAKKWNERRKKLPILALDFDGVIHSYVSGWKGATEIPDPPVEGAALAIACLFDAYRIVIFSARADEIANPGGRHAIAAWLAMCGIPFDDITAIKPPAFLLVDDRAICFAGHWADTMKSIREFRHYFQGEHGCGAPAVAAPNSEPQR